MATVAQITTAEQLLKANLQHCELIRGQLLMTEAACFERGRIACELGGVLADWTKPRRQGVVVSAGVGFQVAYNPDTVLVPDVAFVRAERIPIGGEKGFFQGPPDIAVEVVLPGGRASAVLAKARDWLKAGCPLVWGVDPETRTISVYRSRSEVTVLNKTDTLTGGDVLPGFSTPVAEIFA
jgi:Uma2 family endonuclease